MPKSSLQIHAFSDLLQPRWHPNHPPSLNPIPVSRVESSGNDFPQRCMTRGQIVFKGGTLFPNPLLQPMFYFSLYTERKIHQHFLWEGVTPVCTLPFSSLLSSLPSSLFSPSIPLSLPLCLPEMQGPSRVLSPPLATILTGFPTRTSPTPAFFSNAGLVTSSQVGSRNFISSMMLH